MIVFVVVDVVIEVEDVYNPTFLIFDILFLVVLVIHPFKHWHIVVRRRRVYFIVYILCVCC